MQKIGLMVCGNSGVDYQDLGFPIRVMHSMLQLGDKEYEDYVDITAEAFYEVIVNNPDIHVSTSQTPTWKMVEFYEAFKAEGHTDVIVVTISNKLSGTYQGSVLAGSMVEGLNVHVVDSLSVSQGEVYLLQEAVKLIKEGKKTAKQIVDRLNQIKVNMKIYVLVDTLKYLVKNGRLSATSGFLGTLLKIKPLLHIQPDGALVPLEKIRTTSKARERLLEIFMADIENKKVDCFIAYTNNKEDAESYKALIEEKRSDVKVELVPLTPVVGAHAGPGTLGVGYIVR